MILPRAVRIALVAVAMAGCSRESDQITDYVRGPEEFAAPGHSLLMEQGGELRLIIRSVGPGEYASPPEMVGSSIDFVDAQLATVQVPAGPTQIFRFAGRRRGTTIVRFHNTVSSSVVADTVIVR